MTLVDFFTQMIEHPEPTVAVLVALPLLVGALAFLLKIGGHVDASQAAANAGIALALVVLVAEIIAWMFAATKMGVDPLAEVQLLLLLAPPFMLVMALAVEHLLHPGKQERIRRAFRRLLFTLVTTALLVAIVRAFSFHFVVWTSLRSFLLMVLAAVAVVYVVLARLFG